MFQSSIPSVNDSPPTHDSESSVKGQKRARDEEGDQEPRTKKTALDDLLGDVYVTKAVCTESVFDKVENEVGRYKSQASISLSECPLIWWKERQADFPLLSQSARVWLCIPSTSSSVPSERVFSTAGDIVTAQRSALSGDNVDKLIFLKKNIRI
jgi:hypothetical protein